MLTNMSKQSKIFIVFVVCIVGFNQISTEIGTARCKKTTTLVSNGILVYTGTRDVQELRSFIPERLSDYFVVELLEENPGGISWSR